MLLSELTAVMQARAGAVTAPERAAQAPGDPAAMRALSGAETALTGALGRLLVVTEAYPDLKGDRTMSQLMEELTSTENRIAFARQSFNDAVTSYETQRQTFPINLVSGRFGFKEAELLRIEEPAMQQPPKVSFATS